MDGGATASARWIGNDVSGKLTNCSSISVKSNIFTRGHSGNSTQLRKISVTEPNFNHRKKITIMSQNIRMIHLYDCDFTWWLASLSPWTIYPLIAALRKPHFERTFQLRRNEGKIQCGKTLNGIRNPDKFIFQCTWRKWNFNQTLTKFPVT